MYFFAPLSLLADFTTESARPKITDLNLLCTHQDRHKQRISIYLVTPPRTNILWFLLSQLKLMKLITYSPALKQIDISAAVFCNRTYSKVTCVIRKIYTTKRRSKNFVCAVISRRKRQFSYLALCGLGTEKWMKNYLWFCGAVILTYLV